MARPLLAQSVDLVVTGALAGAREFFGAAFVMTGCVKLGYDFLMLKMFLGCRTQEERVEDVVVMTEQEEGVVERRDWK